MSLAIAVYLGLVAFLFLAEVAELVDEFMREG